MSKSPSIWKHRKWFADKGELGEHILRAKNLPEFEKRVQWLSYGALMYHLFYTKINHGGSPEEHALYKEFMEYVLNNNMIRESNTKKKTDEDAHSWFQHPKSQGEKRQHTNSTEQGVPVRGKRSPRNLGDLYDDNPIPFKKQNSKKKPGRKTIRKEEDEQSVYKQMQKNNGRVTFNLPKVKPHKRYAPGTKTEPSGKLYKRKEKNENDLDKSGKAFSESVSISKFIEAIMTKNHAQAHKQLKNAINSKIQKRIAQEIDNSLF